MTKPLPSGVGDGVVKLSTYGSTPPSQLGVTTMGDVKLHVDFRGQTR